jgi:hypothetical protein
MAYKHATKFIFMLLKMFIYNTFMMPIAMAPVDGMEHPVPYSLGTLQEIQASAESILVEILMICSLWDD